MTRRQFHRKRTYCWRPAIGFAVAYALVVGVTAVALAYVVDIFSERAATAVRHLPGVLGSLAALVGMVSRILTSSTTAGNQSSVSSRSARAGRRSLVAGGSGPAGCTGRFRRGPIGLQRRGRP
jgi:predicted PurR-regulated permease PerM